MTDLIPPQDLAAEEAVLGALLTNDSAVDAVADLLAPGDFFRISHGVLYEAALKMRAAGEPVDVITLSARFPDLRSEVHAYAQAVPAATAVVHYAKIVADTARRRRLIVAGKGLTRLGYEENDVAATMAEGERLVFDALMGRDAHAPVEMADALKQIEAELKERVAGKQPHDRLRCGVGVIDNVGGLERSGLHILAARPATGKTALALKIAVHVARFVGPVLFASLEMTVGALGTRLIESECQAGRETIASGKLDELQQERLADLIAAMSATTLKVIDTPKMGVVEVRAAARRIHVRSPLALIVVDYVGLLHTPSSKRNQNREREVAEISGGLKALARELDCPVLALSQLNRQVELRGKEEAIPRLSDLRESGSLEQDADMVVFLARDDKRQRDLGRDRNHPLQRIAVAVSKHRNGPTAIGALEFHRTIVAFDEVRT